MDVVAKRAEAHPAAARRPGWWTSTFQRPPYYGISILALLLLLALWEVAVHVFEIRIVILPPPSLVFRAVIDYALKGSLWADLLTTGRRAMLGLALGMIVGVGLGLLIGWYPRFRAAVNPIVAITFPIPKIALVPLFIIWFGLGDSFKIILIISAAITRINAPE